MTIPKRRTFVGPASGREPQPEARGGWFPQVRGPHLPKPGRLYVSDSESTQWTRVWHSRIQPKRPPASGSAVTATEQPEQVTVDDRGAHWPSADKGPYRTTRENPWVQLRRTTVTAWAGPAIVRWAVREERGQIYCAPEVLQITNRYDENDGVSKRVRPGPP